MAELTPTENGSTDSGSAEGPSGTQESVAGGPSSTYRVTWDCSQAAAEARLDEAGNGRILPDGSYQRETTITAVAEMAIEDPEASVEVV